MARFALLLAVAACAGPAALPAVAQQPYPQQPYPQQPYEQQPYEQQQYPQQYQQPYEQYPQQPYQQPYPGQTYPQQGYGYEQGYNQNAIGAVIDGLIGNRYNVSDRQAIHQCAYAAIQRAHAGYAGGYPQPYGNYPQAYGGYGNHGWMQVTSITEVRRKTLSVRVRGTLGSRWNGAPAYGTPGYGAPPYGGPAYGGAYGHHDLSFRCDVDYNGYVRDVRLEPLARAY